MARPEYATLPELKSWLTGITGTDRDVMLTRVLATASRWVDSYTRRHFSLDPAPSQKSYSVGHASYGSTLYVDDIGSLDGLAVEGVTTYEASPADALAAGRPIEGLYVGSGWGSYGGTTVRVTARWGWPAVPEEVTQATLIQAARLFKRKDSPEGVLGSADWGTIRVGRTDPDVAALLAPYRLLAVS